MAWTTPGTAVAGDVLTAAFWNTQVRDNSNALYNSTRRIAFDSSRTTNYTINQSALASAADFFSSDITWTADGTTAYRIEFFAPIVLSPATAGISAEVILVDGSGSSLARLGNVGDGNGSQPVISPIFAVFFYTPAAGSAAINVRATRSSGGNGTIEANSTDRRVWLAVYGPDLT